MGTNLAPILANLYLAMLQEELKKKCVNDQKLKWPKLFLRFIDDGFGIMEGAKKDVEYWIKQFNSLRKTIKIDKWSFGNSAEYMDIYIYKGEKFFSTGLLDFRIFQKEINRYMYIPAKSGHVSHTIKNYVLGELKRYIRYNSLKLTFLKIRTKFFSRLRNRGFKKVINVQGSDHHGTIARVRSGLQGVAQKRGWDIPKTYPDYVLHKMVTVMRHGEEVKISKRAGSYVTVRDLVEWSGGVTPEMTPEERELALQRGRDAVRFFLISRKADTEFVFDIDLALQQNDENPVFYVQYAHARISSILQQWDGQISDLKSADLSLLQSKASDHLLRRLAEYPEVLTDAAADLAPHALAFYLRDLAGDFHTFYNADRVLVDDQALKLARLALLSATRQVLQNGLKILGVSAPAKM